MKTIACLLVTLAVGGIAFADDDDPGKSPTGGKPAAQIKAGIGVEKHEIVGEAATFPAGTTVWVWSRITNGEGSVKHVWKQDGKELWTATLPVSSKRWSTQTRRTISKPGEYEVDVTTADGTDLGSVKFTVQ